LPNYNNKLLSSVIPHSRADKQYQSWATNHTNWTFSSTKHQINCTLPYGVFKQASTGTIKWT